MTTNRRKWLNKLAAEMELLASTDTDTTEWFAKWNRSFMDEARRWTHRIRNRVADMPANYPPLINTCRHFGIAVTYSAINEFNECGPQDTP